MASTGLEGPFSLILNVINQAITKVSPGTYVLGHTSGGSFIVKYVGRSDSDLNKRLQNWIGKYNEFKCSYMSSPKAAFEKECMIYHDFEGPTGKLDNDIHPQRPQDSDWQCPSCDTFKKFW